MWSMLILSLPTHNSSARMRAWRALKALGAAVLRDGVFLLPEPDALTQALRTVAAEVRAGGSRARVLAGMRDALADDDQLFLAAAGVFEGLWVAFDKEARS